MKTVRHGSAILLLAATSLLVAGCATNLTDEEWARLNELVLDAPAESSTNAAADDPRAAALGKLLYFDPRFSGPLLVGDDGGNGGLGPVGATGRVSCASCHDPAAGGSDQRSRGPTSLGASWTGRNAPTVLNAARARTPWTFWDGRKDSLWSQALGPTESPAEHNSSRLQIAHHLYDRYQDRYAAIFGPLPDLTDVARFPPAGKPGEPSFDQMAPGDRDLINRVFANYGKAIEAYERLLIDTEAPFDRYIKGDSAALSAAAIRGAKLFVGRAACDECHSGPLLSDGKFHNHGIPQYGPEVPLIDRGRADGIPAVKADPFNAAGPYSDRPRFDLLSELSAAPSDLGAFKTPTLRNCNRTPPYMHTGGVTTLRDVVVLYRDAAGTDGFIGTRDPRVRPLALSDEDVTDLVEFLKSLDGAPLPADLVTPPVLP